MNKARAGVFVAVALMICCEAMRAGDDSAPTTEPAAPVSVNLKPDRTEAYPGEGIRLIAVLKVEGKSPLIVPTGGTIGVLHVKTPDGVHLVLGYGHRGRGQVVPAGSAIVVGEYHLSLVDSPLSWKTAGGEAIGKDVSFRKPGTYELWCDIERAAGWHEESPVAGTTETGTTVEAWNGKVSSKVTVLTVKALTKDVIQDQPSPKNLDGLRIIKQGKNPIEDEETKDAYDRISQEMELAPNDGLAKAVVELLREGTAEARSDPSGWWWKLEGMAIRRAWDGYRFRMEGSYLRPLVELQVDILKEWYKQEPLRVSRYSDVDYSMMTPDAALLVAYIRANDVPELRKSAVNVAEAHARLPENQSANDPTIHRYYHARLGVSWSILIGLDVLNGMSLEETKAILGEPTRTYGDTVEWYYSSQMHVNPGLRVQLKEGKAVEAKGFRG
ncbi:MAG: hypothetical protein WBD63_07850 [Phycisphaerae bacterium]|nr:hypothetical protein [Phycisphaerae bacterium]